jgi:hypothetical protein
MKKVLLLLALVSANSYSATITQNIGDDAAFNLFLQNLGVPGFQTSTIDYTQEIFAVQGRIGNNANSGTNEIGLHWNNPADSTPPTSSSAIAGTGSTQFVWGSASSGASSNALTNFILQRAGNTITFTFGNTYTASLTDTKAGNVNFIGIRARAEANANTSEARIRLNDLNLNGNAIGSTGAYDNTNNGATVVTNFLIAGLTGDFTLTGTAALDWNGTTPTNSALAFQFKAFENIPNNAVPEPATYFLIGSSLIFGAARFRARRS